jgi:hypothetical protein
MQDTNRQEDEVTMTQMALPSLDELRSKLDSAAPEAASTPSITTAPAPSGGGFRRGSDAAAQSETSKMPKALVNKYDADCTDCGQRVFAGEGRLSKPSGRWIVSHVGDCPAPEPVEVESNAREGEQPVAMDERNPYPGIYTVEDNEGHVTLRVFQQQMDAEFAPGELLVEYLVGRDNENDYKGFGFIKAGRLIVWKKHQHAVPGYERRYVKAARVLLENPAAVLEAMNCPRCNAILSNPVSIAAGIGPDCRKLWGW